MFYEDEYLKVDTVDTEVVYDHLTKNWSDRDIRYMTEKSCIRISNKLKEINFPRKVIIYVNDNNPYIAGSNILKHTLTNGGTEDSYLIINGNTNFSKESHIPLTPWIVLHRCVHAIQLKLETQLMSWYCNIQELKNFMFNKSLVDEVVVGMMLTSKSRKYIRNHIDFEAEIITQYFYNGNYELNFMADDYQEILKEKLNVLGEYFQNNTIYTKGYNHKEEQKKVYEFLINPDNEKIVRKIMDTKINKAIEILNSDIGLAF